MARPFWLKSNQSNAENPEGASFLVCCCALQFLFSDASEICNKIV